MTEERVTTRAQVFLDRLNGRILAVLVAVLLLAATYFVFAGDGGQRTLTAHFSRAVAIYKGSEVRLMGVRIGTVDAVVPEGESVRVEMSYDADYKLPADAKAMIVTPTLVADRFVQISPAWTKGAVMEDGADIPLAKTATPIEVDRIYKGLAELSDALGPQGANQTGALGELIAAGADALRGQGKLANQTITDLSAAAEVFGDNSGPLFSSVRQLSELTEVLAANDRFVNQFMGDLAGVSSQLAGEREELEAALAALADAVGTVRTFVGDNRRLVESEVKELNTVISAIAKEQKALGTALQLAPLGLGNLATAFDVKTGSIGARVQLGPTVQSLGNVLCDIVVNSGTANTETICKVLKAVTAPLANEGVDVGASIQLPIPGYGAQEPADSLAGMLGGRAR